MDNIDLSTKKNKIIFYVGILIVAILLIRPWSFFDKDLPTFWDRDKIEQEITIENRIDSLTNLIIENNKNVEEKEIDLENRINNLDQNIINYTYQINNKTNEKIDNIIELPLNDKVLYFSSWISESDSL